MINLSHIESFTATLPGAQISTSYGTPAVKVGKTLLMRMHQKEDAIVMSVGDADEQQTLIAADPMTFYITDHYDGYPFVLVRPTIDPAAFEALLLNAWRRVASKSDQASYDEP